MPRPQKNLTRDNRRRSPGLTRSLNLRKLCLQRGKSKYHAVLTSEDLHRYNADLFWGNADARLSERVERMNRRPRHARAPKNNWDHTIARKRATAAGARKASTTAAAQWARTEKRGQA